MTLAPEERLELPLLRFTELPDDRLLLLRPTDDPEERLLLLRLRFTELPEERLLLRVLPTEPLLPRLDDPERFTVPRFVLRPVERLPTLLRVLVPLLLTVLRAADRLSIREDLALARTAERLLLISGRVRLIDDRPEETRPVLLAL